MQKYTLLDFEDNEPIWTEIEVGQPGEELVLLELTDDWQIVIMSNKRNVYISSDQGVTWIDQGQISRLRYWGKRARRWWQNCLLIFNYFIGKSKTLVACKEI